MTTDKITHFAHSAVFAAVSAITIVALATFGLVMAEPQIGHSQGPGPFSFEIQQTITGEATFLVEPTDIVMDGNISGITGGNATGTTQFAVQSNTAGGHFVTINFVDNVGQYTMRGDVTGSEDIIDFNYGNSGEPIFGFPTTTAAQFGYTVISSSTNLGDTDDSFEYTGSTCNTGGTDADGSCYATPSSSAFRIVDRNTPAPTGATTSIIFKVNVPSGLVTAPSAETYTATATLTLTTQ